MFMSKLLAACLNDSPSLIQRQGNPEINKRDRFLKVEFLLWHTCITKEICQNIKSPLLNKSELFGHHELSEQL